ncbi:hypothetical protein [Agrococcus sp. SGAir0287]|uniref:hypothetical protein n=1 Tax=Agrococcus sp. SGAir0287 TaxID=2070347 RepID=UPI0010CD1DAE|nr:hypothetical protein [Agrococcus sp. SGAir0287]QCR19654.1 hypothetical protein C1N71_09665 [Agrococcus sp. SGAir0287]
MTDTMTRDAAPAASTSPPHVPPPRRRRRWTDDARRRLRRILMLVLVPITIAGLVLAGKLMSVNAFADASQNAYERRAYQEAELQARGLQWWNVLEPWKAPYDVGVALGMQGSPEQLVEARALLEEALSLNGEEGSNEYCVILVSIVYVVEKQGDQAREAADTQTANGLYQEALGIIDAAPEGCFAEPTPIQADTGEQLEQSVPRIEEKIEDESGGGGDSDQESEGGESSEDPSEGDGEPQTQQEQLEEQNQQAQEQQQQQDEYNQQQGEEPGGGGVDQPW